MAWTDRYVASDASGGDGLLITTPWTLAEAIANEAAGMRLNVKAGTYANTTTSRTFAAVGTATAPILWEGYSVTPGDICGRAGLPANNALAKPVISFTTGQLIVSGAFHRMVGLDITSACVSAPGAVNASGVGVKFHRCRVTNTAANSAAAAIKFNGTNCIATSCYFSATTTAASVYANGAAGSHLQGCTFRGGIVGVLFQNSQGLIQNCVAKGYTTTGFDLGNSLVNNTCPLIACSAYGGTNGVLIGSASSIAKIVNCVFSTCTNGVNQSAGTNGSGVVVQNCAFYSVTNPVVGVQECATAADDLYVQQGNVTLTADPFVNAAGHDFSLNPASAARGAGIPGAFENESYVAYTDAGAVGNARIWKRASERVAR